MASKEEMAMIEKAMNKSFKNGIVRGRLESKKLLQQCYNYIKDYSDDEIGTNIMNEIKKIISSDN